MGETNKKVVLLPKTIDYYQVQLTRMLENEQYHEAADLLRFLLSCTGEDDSTYTEWQALLEWLNSQFIHIDESDDKEIEEVDLLSHHIQEKLSTDKHYANKIMDMLKHSASLEKQLLALEQLAFIPEHHVHKELMEWLEQKERNPLAQFKALQVLKQHGIQKEIRLRRFGDVVVLDTSKTPLQLGDYPEPIQKVLELVRERSEINHPNLAYFAEQTWKDFLSFIYGSAQYELLLQHCHKHVNACAAALHYISLNVMSGNADDAEIMSLYKATDHSFPWESVRRMLEQFIYNAMEQGDNH